MWRLKIRALKPLSGCMFALCLVALAPIACRTQENTGDAASDRDPPHLQFGYSRLPDGVRLHYAEQGNTAGPVVLLLHGYSDSWFSWSLVLPLLPLEWHVLALDMRGHGESDKPPTGYLMRELAGDVLEFMEIQGIERATVVGHSGGSFVAQQVALAAPHRVERLILVSSATTARNIVGIEELRAAVEALQDPVPEPFVREFQESTVYGALPHGFLDRVVAESLKLPAHVWKAYMKGMLATGPAPELRSLSVPILILWGDRDAAFGPDQEALLAMFPNATRATYPETGHGLHWERPERFARDLASFLADSNLTSN